MYVFSSISDLNSSLLLNEKNTHEIFNRSFLSTVDDGVFAELSESVSNCDLIFDFPAVRETPR